MDSGEDASRINLAISRVMCSSVCGILFCSRRQADFLIPFPVSVRDERSCGFQSQHTALICRKPCAALHASGLRPLLCQEITFCRRDAVCVRPSAATQIPR